MSARFSFERLRIIAGQVRSCAAEMAEEWDGESPDERLKPALEFAEAAERFAAEAKALSGEDEEEE